MNKALLLCAAAVISSLYWLAPILHNLPEGDLIIGILAGLVPTVLLTPPGRSLAVTSLRLGAFGLFVFVVGWTAPLLRILPAGIGQVFPDTLIGLGIVALVMTEKLSLMGKTYKR